MIRLYQFYNMEKSQHGSPFALCDDCKPEQPVPDVCVLDCIANQAKGPCALCGKGAALDKAAKNTT